ncbi:DUF3048 domain-containing protein [Metabacillus indicus]|uniref:DUF3048 domain-containing protein n=1 Tax=Metabacillus indicus TaxID=246786 RepID=UPI003CEF57E7
MKTIKKNVQRLLAAVMLLALCTACVKEESSVPKPSVIKQEPSAPAEEISIYPLTGLPSENLGNRAFAVMINNHPAARPQSGLHKADIVYEVLAEGSITRFLAIYQSELPEMIGPVRSAREYYVDLADGYNAFFISHGWSPQARELLEDGNHDFLNGMFYDGTLFERADFRKAPHNSYISSENIKKGAELNKADLLQKPDPLPFMKAAEGNKLQRESAAKAVIRYDKSGTFESQFIYDKQSQTYFRYSNEQTKDLQSDEAVAPSNVLIAEMTHEIMDKQGRRSINLTEGGKAILLQHGVSREVEWRNADGRILPYLNGEQVKLVPGKTWISIVPHLNQVTLH